MRDRECTKNTLAVNFSGLEYSVVLGKANNSNIADFNESN